VRNVDLNVDVGEGFPFDEELMRLATSANVGCGAHAGSPESSVAAAHRARELGLAVGLHPGYPDRGSMGRAPWDDRQVAAATDHLVEQCLLFEADYVKPHGAFYNQSAAQAGVRDALVACLCRVRLPLVGLPGTLHVEAAEAAGVRFVAEGFAERGYRPDGTLVPRGEPGAELDAAEAAQQARTLAGSVETVCVHGDRPDACSVLAAVRRALEADGYRCQRCV
jgi:UPF0271 protein